LGENPALLVVNADGSFDVTNAEQVFTYPPLGADLVVPVPTSHFYRVVQCARRTRIAAATNNHVQGVLLAILKVETSDSRPLTSAFPAPRNAMVVWGVVLPAWHARVPTRPWSSLQVML
jgi:hypothetical protein